MSFIDLRFQARTPVLIPINTFGWLACHAGDGWKILMNLGGRPVCFSGCHPHWSVIRGSIVSSSFVGTVVPAVFD